MKTAFIISGIVLALSFGVIIAREKENSNYLREHPFKTLYFGTPNPEESPYTYTSPFTFHEIVMMSGVVAGIVLIVVGIKTPSKKAISEKENK